MEIKQLTDEQFDEAIAKGTVLVDVFTTWCEAAADECPDVKFYKVDADACPDVTLRYMIRSVPTLLLFKDGDLADTSIGLISKQEVLDLVK